MSTPRPAATPLDDQPIPVRAKLAAAWTSFMFLYAYVDILGFYTPGVALELVVLALVVRYAWTWPRTAPSATTAGAATHPVPETVRAAV
jgi:hypothetical protein